MDRVKRIVVGVLVVGMLLLTGCAPKDTTEQGTGPQTTGNLDPASPTTVTLWHYYVGENQQALETAVAEFNQSIGLEDGVIVEPVAMGTIAELESGITASAQGVINSKPMPQIFSSYPDKAMEIDGFEMVVDLNEYFTDEEKALYVSDFLADGIFSEGRMLVLPVVKSTELMYVNATQWNAFAQAQGYNEDSLATWESLYDTARAYYQWHDAQTPDVPWDGSGLMGFDSVANYVIIGNRQLGVNVIDAKEDGTGQATLDETALRRIFDLYYQGMSLGYFDAVGKFRSDDIKAGVLAAYVGSSSSAAYFPTWIEEDRTETPIDFLALPYPVFEGGESSAIQQGAGMCVAKSTPAQQEASVLFLKWFTAPEQNIRFSMTTGYLPVQSAAYSSDAFQEALTTLRAGDKAGQNVADVYEIALNQITESNTYAAKPFDGSYAVRSILQSSLIDMGAQGEAAAQSLKEEGLTEDEILAQLDVDAQFSLWLETIKKELDSQGILYV